MSRMHISHLSGTGKSGDNLTALGAQRISALQKAMKNLSHFCDCTKKRSVPFDTLPLLEDYPFGYLTATP